MSAGILLRPHVAGHHGAVGRDRQVAPVAGLHVPVRQAQTIGDRLRRAIDHAGIEPAGDLVDRRGRVLVPAPVAGSITLRVIGMLEPSGKHRIAVRDGDVDVVDAIGGDEIEVVVDELAPRIHEGRKTVRIGNAGVAFANHIVGDGRGLTVSIGSEMPSAKCAVPTRVMSVAVALKFWLLPVPSIERYAVMQWFPCLV